MQNPTILNVHLDHIRFNIEGIQKAVGPDRKVLVAVKANGYGHGAVEISRMAEEIGVDWLGVATVLEGIQLREADIHLPILKFSPTFPEEMEAAVKNQLTLTICSPEEAKNLEKVCQTLGMTIDVHLKVDTGMGRVGVVGDGAVRLAKMIDDTCKHLNLDGIMTHLPVSDGGDPTFTREQIARFKDIRNQVNTSLGRKLNLAHCSNSGAILGHPDGWLDMVRPGIMVYGYYPGKETPRTIPLKPGITFKTKISFLKKVPPGTSIGYGRTWLAPEETWIATIPVGYADGFNRLFSNKGRVLIGGKSYPIIGRVCMDQSMVNLGPHTDCHVGDEVVLLGSSGENEISCDEWAEKLGTITYEVVCQINSRVERVYGPVE